jgi:pyruvate/2-oxoglutarate dehydrogenase complex dihydrolipoamide acyltransferase (E2) component
LLEIESEKSQCEIEAPATGRLMEIRAAINEELPVGAVLGLISTD